MDEVLSINPSANVFFHQKDWLTYSGGTYSKAKSAIPPLLKGSEVLFFASDKEKLFAKKFSKNSNFDVSSTSTCFLF